MADKSIFFGKDVEEIDMDEYTGEDSAEQKLVAQFALSVRKAITSRDFIPPMLPEVAIRLSEMANKPEVTIKEVESAVVRDPTVAARIVAVANSVFYSRGASVKSLKDAIMRLGLSEVRDVAFQVVAKTTIFRVPGFADRMRELFDAAQAAGLFAKRVCQISRVQSESAYLCGLLHDMGEAIILGIAAPVSKQKAEMSPVESAAFKAAVEIYHAQTGAMVSTMWGLPDMVCDAILHHHHPHRSQDPSQMALVTAVSDQMLSHIGLGVPKRTVNLMQEPMLCPLNLSPSDVETLLSFAEEVNENRESLDPV